METNKDKPTYLNLEQELYATVQNLMGILDTPVGRKQNPSDFADEARLQARETLEKYQWLDQSESSNSNNSDVIVICDSCENSINGLTCLVKHKFKADGKSQSEFIKILGGYCHTCSYFIPKLPIL